MAQSVKGTPCKCEDLISVCREGNLSTVACTCDPSERKWKQEDLASLAYLVSSRPGRDDFNQTKGRRCLRNDGHLRLTSGLHIHARTQAHTCMLKYTSTYDMHTQ